LVKNLPPPKLFDFVYTPTHPPILPYILSTYMRRS
jgi:hypothetical protein